MIHVNYLILITLVLSFFTKMPAATESTATPSEVVPRRCADGAKLNAPGLATMKSLSSQGADLVRDGAENDSRFNFDTEDIFKQLPRQYLFDPKVVTQRTKIDVSTYTARELIEESEYETTYRLTAPNGHFIEQIVNKADGSVTHEKWKDDQGGEIKRSKYEFGMEERYTDKNGDAFEINYVPDGSYNITRRSAKGISETYGYDKDGNVTGVFVYRHEVEL